MTFTQRYIKDLKENLKCPKCEADLVFIHGSGFDYDLEYCSVWNCDYELQYDTTTLVEESEVEMNSEVEL